MQLLDINKKIQSMRRIQMSHENDKDSCCCPDDNKVKGSCSTDPHKEKAPCCTPPLKEKAPITDHHKK
jgi:hypothetical protein